ncbi:histone deacetylase [Kribbella sp. NPDC048915]|uniref:histone deacetylase n=1 Tax=Kribbella sp. NPDC048915 TaxID=3155148 RepID=UPI0034069FE0
MKRVWYVAYGSNLALGRFRCYLAGGRPVGGARVYAGCRDRSDPARMERALVPGGLMFAGASTVWGGGSALFDPATAGQVAARAYLLTPDQVGDVAAQEMRREPGGRFARDVASVLPDVEESHTMGPGRYETVVRLGERGGAPMFTVTHDSAGDLDPVAPTAPYLRWIATGLAEAHGWAIHRVVEYLHAAPGVRLGWTPGALRSALDAFQDSALDRGAGGAG